MRAHNAGCEGLTQGRVGQRGTLQKGPSTPLLSRFAGVCDLTPNVARGAAAPGRPPLPASSRSYRPSMSSPDGLSRGLGWCFFLLMPIWMLMLSRCIGVKRIVIERKRCNEMLANCPQ